MTRQGFCGTFALDMAAVGSDLHMTFEVAEELVRQCVISPAAGKRLIGKAIARHQLLKSALASGTVVVIAGTTNGYVAEELLAALGQLEGFVRQRFFRGVTLPPAFKTTGAGRLPDESQFPGDVVLVRGTWEKGKSIFDVIDDLREGDVILKGANAVDLNQGRAAVLVGDRKAGTIGAALQAVIGRRVRLILPVGVEKRVVGDLDAMAMRLNAPNAKGPRLLPVPGLVFTELDALRLLSGATAELVAAGGVCGAEGSAWLAVRGSVEQIDRAESLLQEVASEPPFQIPS